MFLVADNPQCDNRQTAAAYLPRSGGSFFELYKVRKTIFIERERAP